MIRANDISADSEQTSSHHFNRIVRAARPTFLSVNIDEANHVATGLLESDSGKFYRAFLSYEDRTRRIRIVVTLRLSDYLSHRQRSVLEQLQCSSEMSRFDPDREHHTIILRVTSVCSQPLQPKFTVDQIVQDIRRVLSDDRLKVVLSD